ncbi:MAG: hypothetical protein ACTSU5_08550 [Promethearchaeota archaeon]
MNGELLRRLTKLFYSPRVKSKYSAKVLFSAHFESLGWKLLEPTWGDVVARDPNGTIHVLKVWWNERDTPLFFVKNFLEPFKEKNAACQARNRFSARCEACTEQCPLSKRLKLYFFTNAPLGYEAYQYYKMNEFYLKLVLTPEARKNVVLRGLRKRNNLPKHFSEVARQGQKTLDKFLARTTA